MPFSFLFFSLKKKHKRKVTFLILLMNFYFTFLIFCCFPATFRGHHISVGFQMKYTHCAYRCYRSFEKSLRSFFFTQWNPTSRDSYILSMNKSNLSICLFAFRINSLILSHNKIQSDCTNILLRLALIQNQIQSGCSNIYLTGDLNMEFSCAFRTLQDI